VDTYLFLWNPSRDVNSFRKFDTIQANADSGTAYATKWVCPSKKPQPGDIALMQRTGRTNNGIFARGSVTKGAFESTDGKQFVKLRLDSFLPLGLEISRKSAMTRAGYQNIWGPQASGSLVPPEIAIALDALWKEADLSPAAFEEVELADRVQSLISRIQRDTVATKALKSKYDYRCQVCDIDLPCGFDKKYIEVHHIRPLGRPHDGPDSESNMLVLCPNHHSLFDLGVPKFVNDSSLEISGESFELTIRHKINKAHIAYYKSNLCHSSI
jgi:hypothetical protein